MSWSKQTGPGTVTFSNAAIKNPHASFSLAGSYVLVLNASDGAATGSDTVAVTVAAVQPPATPTFTPNGGTFSGSVAFSAATATPGAVVRYTTNGTDPTATSPQLTATTVLTSTTTVKARAFKTGAPDSAVATATFTVNASSRVGAGLAGLWRFDDGAGAVVRDSSGVGTPLDLNIADTTKATWSGGSLAVAGTGLASAAATKINGAVTTSNEFTFEAWIDPAAQVAPAPGRIVLLGEDQNNYNFLFGQGLNAGGANDVYRGLVRSTGTGTPALKPVAHAGLTHLVFTRKADGSTQLYLDGVLADSRVGTGNMSNWNATRVLRLGSAMSNRDPWSGSYHLAAFYSRALTAAEVQTNFAAGA